MLYNFSFQKEGQAFLRFDICENFHLFDFTAEEEEEEHEKEQES